MTPSVEADTRTNRLKRKRAFSESEEVPRLPYCDAWRIGDEPFQRPKS